MKLEIGINGVVETIDILDRAPDCRFRLGDGPERLAHIELPEPGVYSVLMDGRSYDVRIEDHPGGRVAVVEGFRFEMAVRDPRRLARGGPRRAGEGPETIAAPMPGKVVRVLAAPGDTVESGQGLVVVEAMKMQNEMKAPRAGRVLSVAAREGATVSAGDVLATLE